MKEFRTLSTPPVGGFPQSRVSMFEGNRTFSNNHYGLPLEVI